MPAVALASLLGASKMPNNSSSNSSGASSSGQRTSSGASVKSERCSNPFRIPRHDSVYELRYVPQLIRERLTHVHFGRKICLSCRNRVYAMLKERKQLNYSTRLSGAGSSAGGANSAKRRSEPAPTSAKLQKSRSSDAGQTNGQVAAVIRTVKETAAKGVMKPTTEVDVGDKEVILPGTSSSSSANGDSNLTDNSSTPLEHTMSRRSRSQALPQQQQQQQLMQRQGDAVLVKRACCFCGLGEDNEVEFGKFYEHNGILTHYYCLLLSSNMEQKGNDDEGILGFLADDIQKEIRRGKRLVCSYCKKNGATLGCCNAKCKRIFHFPCGLKAGSLHQFFGEFRSYCINHRPRQKIDDRVKKEIENMSNILCYICYEDVKPLDSNGTLWAPCCKKNAWFHRKCVQLLAMSAGYFFKCPLCNNKREFQTAMLEYGIYIPRQDASWELVPNAFEELLYRHDRCDAKTCHCPKGRTYTSTNAKWELTLCRMCGSQGTHIFCGQLKWANPIWDCEECISILKKPSQSIVTTDDSTSNSNSNEIIRAGETTTLKLTVREFEEDSDSDISVGNESIPLGNNLNNIPTNVPPVKLRPGPRSFKLQQVEKLKSAEANKECTNNKNPNNDNTPVNQKISNNLGTTSKTATRDVICIDSDDEEVPQIVCESVMKPTVRKRINTSLGTPLKPTEVDLVASEAANVMPQPIVQENDSSPFNIIISNVTSVPPEFFASVPEEPCETSEILMEPLEKKLLPPNAPELQKHLKRNHPDEEDDCEIVVETPKRPRLEGEALADQNSSGSSKIACVESLETVSLPTIKQSPSKVAVPNALAGSSGLVSSSLDSCHGNAGTRPALVDTGRISSHDGATIDSSTDGTAATTATSTNEPPCSESTSPDASAAAYSTDELAIRTVLENGSSSHCSSSRSGGGSSKSRYSSCDRSGLIPDCVSLSDLKFKIYGEDLELLYGTCKIQVKLNSMKSSLNDAGNVVSASVSSFAGSNQNMSSEKSSKSFQLRYDDSSESDRQSRSLRPRTLRSFVYEDDNTLLEYPTSASDSQSNVRVSRRTQDKRLSARNDLKENWDPEVSSSSNNTFDNSINNNNNQVHSLDLKGENVSSREKSHKNDDASFVQSQREDSSTNQRSLRRSNRIVRHFRSVQNGHINGDSTDSNTNNSFSPSLAKSDNQMTNDQSVRSSRSLRVLRNSDVVNQDKHLKNVNFKDLNYVLSGKINGNRYNNELDTEVDFKVSIDLQKIKNLISAKPDLFFNTKNNGVKRLGVYRVNEKLRVERKSGEIRFLIKSQSFDCLLDINIDNSSSFRSRSKSLNDLSHVDHNDLMSLADRKDCMERKTRRSQRRKTRHFEKPECVR